MLIELGLNFDQKFGDFGVKVGAVGIAAKAKQTLDTNGKAYKNHRDLRAYDIGTVLSYSGFSLAGSYGSLGNSLTNKNLNKHSAAPNNKLKTHFYTLGAAYNCDMLGVSATYMDTYRYGNISKVFSVGAEYYLAPGLTPYASANFASFKSSKDTDKNTRKSSGNVIYLGTALKF